MVRQEIYGYLLAHHAIGALIYQAATEADIDPDRVSYTRTVRIIRRAIGRPFPPSRKNTSAPRSRPTSPASRTSTRRAGIGPTPGHQASPPQLLPRQASQRQGNPPH